MANIVQISYKNPVHQIQLSMLAEVFERRIRHLAEELRGHDRDSGMAHLLDEGPVRCGGSPEAGGEAGGG